MNSIRHRIATAAAIALSAVSVPAAAADVAAQQQPTQQARPAAPNTTNGSQRVCVRMDGIASRLAQTVCKTRAQWDRDGGVPRD